MGYYPILKSHLERLPGKHLTWLIKLAVFLLSGTLLWVLYRMALLPGVTFPEWGYAVLLIVACAAFVVYDLLLSSLIEYYWNRKNQS